MGFLWWGNDKKKEEPKKLVLIKTKPIDKENLDKFAVVLCGGGAAGRWQAGVLICLAQIGVLQNASVFAGTSIGGINTGMGAMFGGNEPSEDGIVDLNIPQPWQVIVDTWESIRKNKDAYNGQMGGLFDNVGLGFGFLFGRSAILDAKPLYKILNNIFGDTTIGKLYDYWKTHVIITSLDLNAQREEFYCSFGENKDMKVVDALSRTSAIPGVFASIKGEDIDKDGKKTTHWHVDGGVGANNPFIAINKYNEAFPNDQVKKVMVVYCYPDAMVDAGTEAAKPDEKSYKSYKDALLRTVSSAMNAQEQIAEMIIEDKVKNSGFEVLALWPSKDPGSPLDFTKTELLQEGYDYIMTNNGIGQGYSYAEDKMVNIIDFLKK